MNYTSITEAFVSHGIQALCRTFFHSVWQGLILAVLTAVILTLTKKSRPAFRYNLLAFSMVAFMLVSSYTFFAELKRQVSDPVFSQAGFLPKTTSVLSSGAFARLTDRNDQQVLIGELDLFLRQNAPVIVLVWLVIFCFKTLQAAGGLVYIHRLKSRNSRKAEDDFLLFVQQLAIRMGIRKNIQLLQSGSVFVPMVTGIFKPVIFVPVGFFANLPASQVEAILLHELAHIRRADYAVNLVQSFCENIFFFNPAVLWLSSLIRAEREHCCDDLAISVTNNTSSFVQALVSFQEHRTAAPSQALAFPGKRNFLLDRIKRIIYKNNKPLNAMEKLFVTGSVIVAVLLSAAFSPAVQSEKKLIRSTPVEKPESVSLEKPVFTRIEKDTLPKQQRRVVTESGSSTIQAEKDNKRYEIENVNGKLTSLKVNGRQIPEADIASYSVEVEEIMEEITEAREQAETARTEADKARAQADVIRDEANKQREQADKVREAADKVRAEGEQSRTSADAERKQADAARADAEKLRAEADKLRIEADAIRQKADESRKAADELRKHADAARKEADKSRISYDKMQSDLIQDLIKEGVVKNKADLSYKLNSQELIVNGVKQPAGFHQKMKDRYVQGEGWETVYHFNGRTGIVITK